MCGSYCKNIHLCAISLGLALGVTLFLFVFFGFVWMMYQGVPPMMAEYIPVLTWGAVIFYSLCGFLKGFIFGLLLALFYDLFICLKLMIMGRHRSHCPCGPACNCVGNCRCCGTIKSTSSSDVEKL